MRGSTALPERRTITQASLITGKNPVARIGGTAAEVTRPEAALQSTAAGQARIRTRSVPRSAISSQEYYLYDQTGNIDRYSQDAVRVAATKPEKFFP